MSIDELKVIKITKDQWDKNRLVDMLIAEVERLRAALQETHEHLCGAVGETTEALGLDEIEARKNLE